MGYFSSYEAITGCNVILCEKRTPMGLYRLSGTFSEDEDREDGRLDSHT